MAISKELKCKTCNKSIRFIDSNDGKKIPVNAKLINAQEVGAFSSRLIVIGRNGQRGFLVDLLEGWAIHFSSCKKTQAKNKKEGGK